MSQHDQVLANDTGANFRADANNALAALFGLSSGASAPSTTVAYQLWADTANGLLKMRNAANSAWISKGPLADAFGVINALLDISGASGGQVKFPATQNASADANTLDDYEEGVFTPTITFGGGATGVTYGAQDGFYTKVGRKVAFSIRLTLSAKGSSTGAAVVGGLPFVADKYYGAAVGFAASLGGTPVAAPHALVQLGGQTIALYKFAASSQAALDDTDFTNTTDLVISGVYHV